MLADIVTFIVETVGAWGYPGIILMMFLESSFFPFPSEVVMIPAGYLAAKGEMNLYAVIAAGVGGSILGAVFNYYLARSLGRKFLLKYGKYMLIKERTVWQMEEFFRKHGHVSTFSGRLIPGVRQYISLPAGIAKMDLKLFVFFTALGAGIWMVVLTLLGYFLGENEAMIKENLKMITIATLVGIALLLFLYMVWHKRKKRQR